MVAAFAIHEGDVLDVLRTLPSESFDGLLSDPPAGISFMGKAWDGDKGGRDQWIAWLADVMREALRVLRPGAHILVWALPRTSHWTATAIENAGFQIREKITHLFGSGFPKSVNIAKALLNERTCVCGENLHGVPCGMGAGDEVPGNEKPHVLAQVRGSRDITGDDGQATDAPGDLRALRDDVPSEGEPSGGQGQILHDDLRGQGSRKEPVIPTASSGDRRARPERLDSGIRALLPIKNVGRAKPGVEGRSNNEEQAWNLCDGSLREVSAGLSADGKGGRLRDGASIADGSVGGPNAGANGSSAPSRSQPKKQRAREPGIVAKQRPTQVSGTRKICEWCGKPSATKDDERWAGYGSALKPAVEEWILARKPLDGTIAHNATTHGTGGINVDGCRVAHAGAGDLAAHVKGVEAIRAKGGTMDGSWKNSSDLAGASEVNVAGRWPSNLVLTHSIDCVKTGTRTRVRTIFGADPNGSAVKSVGFTLGSMAQKRAEVAEVAEVYSCVEGCPVRELDEQSGDRPSTPYPANDAVGAVFPMVHRTAGGYSDSGGASRFFPQFQWTTEDLCAAADIAGATFHPETTRITSAPIDAPDLPAQESADKPVRSHGTARNAASHASPTAEPSGDFARCAAPVSANVNASQRARGVDTSSTHTETCIVPNLANQSRRHENASAEPHTQEIESGSPRSFERSTETIPNTAGNASPAHARTARTPSADIVDNAATQTPIDIMTTTASRRISVGSAAGATYVTTATPEDLGEAGFAKFRYEPKASRYERDFGCDDLPLRTAAELTGREPGSAGLQNPRAGAAPSSGARNGHPCVKSVALTKWLATLLLPPPRADGAPRRIVVPFLGSGSEAVGALRAGWEHVEGIEREADFVAVARARLERWAEVPAHVEPTASKSAKVDERQVSLFGRSP